MDHFKGADQAHQVIAAAMKTALVKLAADWVAMRRQSLSRQNIRSTRFRCR
jgi:hypothetical protein